MGVLPSIASIFNNQLAGADQDQAQSAQWRPPQWQRPAIVTLTVPAQSTTLPTSVSSGVISSTDSSVSLGSTAAPATNTITQQMTYVFDAVLSLEHEQRLEKTRHPVQTGADLSSHAYLQPARVVLYIGMSDAMQAFATGQNGAQPWTGNPSKSVSAYQQLLALQAARQPLTLGTRLNTYVNMLITSLTPQEDYRTVTGLRVRVELEQIFTAAVSTQLVSARPQDTQQTGLGGVTTQQPSGTTLGQFAAPLSGQTPVNVPGAGDFTSLAGQSETQP